MRGEGSPTRGANILIGIFSLVLILLMVSLVLLYQAVSAYTSGRPEQGFYFLVFSLLGLGLSTYMVSLTRGRTMAAHRGMGSVFTLTECLNCGFKSIRAFVKGDYVLKQAEACPKCSKQMVITSVYLEEERRG
ncbi:MAG: hypothetical protein QW057_03880 [Candidatus Bathyarchaeia archaeon]